MPLEWPSDGSADRPKRKKQPGGRSGKGNGTTVGMAVAVFGSAVLLFAAPFVYIAWRAFA